MAAKVHTIPNLKTTYVVKKAGSGDRTVQARDQVTVHATGVVVDNAYQFWSTHDKGQKPFGYQAGVKGVITGWDMGCLGMKIGEVRELTIPPQEGYGKGGFPDWGIPKNATLRFTIEVLQIR